MNEHSRAQRYSQSDDGRSIIFRLSTPQYTPSICWIENVARHISLNTISPAKREEENSPGNVQSEYHHEHRVKLERRETERISKPGTIDECV